MVEPGNLYFCTVTEVSLIADALLSWRSLQMPKDLIRSPWRASLYLFKVFGMQKESLEPHTQNSGVSSLYQHIVS